MKKSISNHVLTCAVALIAAVVSTPTVKADLVYADSAVTTGGEFDTLFTLDNLNDEKLTSAADTISAEIGFKEALGYASKSLKVGVNPVIITFDFTSATDIDAFHLWNNVVGSKQSQKGIKDFTLTFYDGVNGTGRTVGSVYSGTATEAPSTGRFAAETFAVENRLGVRSITLTIANNIESSRVFVGAREIAFNAVVKPPRSVLISIGGVSITLSNGS